MADRRPTGADRRPPAAGPAAPRPAVRTLRVEGLEDRTAPAVLTVTHLGDSGAGSLRGLIDAANATPEADTIRFDPSLARGTVGLGGVADTSEGPSALLIRTAIAIEGAGQTLARAGGAGALRLFLVASGGSLSLANLVLSGGTARGGDGASGEVGGGGGAGMGGAVLNRGALSVDGCTFIGNTAIGGRGGDGGLEAGGRGGGGSPGQNGSVLPADGSEPGGTMGESGGYPVTTPLLDGTNVHDLAVEFLRGTNPGRVPTRWAFEPLRGDPAAPGHGGSAGGDAGGGFGGGAAGAIAFAATPGFGGGAGGGRAGGGGAGLGGAIFNGGGTTSIVNSTFTQNRAGGGAGGTDGATRGRDGLGLGGAIFNLGGRVVAVHATIARNGVSSPRPSGDLRGSGLFSTAIPVDVNTAAVAQVQLVNSILAGNTGGVDLFNGDNAALDASSPNGVRTSGGKNLVETGVVRDDPQLGPLQDNGGFTPTMAIRAGGSAHNRGAAGGGLAFDQRDFARDERPDLGAYEVAGPLAPPAVVPTPPGTPPADPAEASARYAEALYRALLGRGPTSSELDNALSRLASGGRTALVADLWDSNEHRSLQADRVARALLGRSLSDGERAEWVATLRGGGELGLLAFALALPEFGGRLNHTGYVEKVYLALLNRPPTPAELSSAAARLRDGLSRAALVQELLAGTEFLGSQLRGYRRALLGGDPSAAEFAEWLARVRAGEGLAAYPRFLLASDPFAARAAGV